MRFWMQGTIGTHAAAGRLPTSHKLQMLTAAAACPSLSINVYWTSVDWQLRRRRCNAHCKQPPLHYCRNWAIRGKTRCKFHGGMSTGPKSQAGKAKVVAAMVEGRRRWIEAEGRGQENPRWTEARFAG